jgi:RNA polymerase sigma-70 factor (ECF subfamily)
LAVQKSGKLFFNKSLARQKALSDRLGISFSGAKSRVQRARAKIKDQLLECCHFQFDHAGRIIDYQSRCACCASEKCDSRCS